MKKLFIAALLVLSASAHPNETYYGGLAKNYCKQAVVNYVDRRADHEYCFDNHIGGFFAKKDYAHYTAVYSGHTLKIKNRLGDFDTYMYVCIYRTDLDEVLAVQVEKIGKEKTKHGRSSVRF